MKKLIYIGLLLFIAANIVACNNEKEILLETKTVANSDFQSLQQNHDFAITVDSGDSINKTIYGRFDSNIKGCRKISNGITREYTYEYTDDNACTIEKINDNTATVSIKNLSDKHPILLSNIAQENNCVTFNVVNNDTMFATCSLTIHDSTDFFNLLPVSYNAAKGVVPAASIGRVIAEIAIFTVISNVSFGSNDEEIAHLCYAHMEDLSDLCKDNNIKIHHTKKHHRCSFLCE